MSAADPFLGLPLEGVNAIEASAGTGKTYTLATLVVRLVVERGLRVAQVLAVTFTEAATQELRTRVRARLQLARDCIGQPAAPGEGAEHASTRALIDAHLAHGDESAAALQRRLDAAVQEIDLAAIFTIHGFCARVLREHALECGHGFDAPELLANDVDLRERVAADLWRAHGADESGADDLHALWKHGHADLADDLRVLLRERELRPAPDPDAQRKDPAPALRTARTALADAVRAHGDVFRADLLAAVEAKVLNNNSYRATWIDPLFDQLRSWCDAGGDAHFEHDKLPNLTRPTLLSRTGKDHAGRTPDSSVCAAVAGYLDALAASAAHADARRVALLHRLRDDARVRMAAAKRAARVHGYDDLIDGVADALDGDSADALVARLRAQYAVALVDEFQDTDARQWRIFERVFGAASGAPALFVIGDPKQAIYGFRGGDVHAYLAATAGAAAGPKLDANFRSRPAVLQAVGALYARAGEAAFVEPGIGFVPVHAGGSRADADFQRDGRAAPALTLWQAPPPAPDAGGKVKPHRAGHARALATQACVAAIHAVLADARAGRATLAGRGCTRAVEPGDIAVLVRSHGEATRVRDALAAAGIPAVAAGKQSLLATIEARELHLLLLALLHPGDDTRLRAALATLVVGLDAAALDALDADGTLAQWQARAHGWRERLRRGGPVALVADLASARAGALLGLVDGERRLTNLLQVAELLQDARAGADGLRGLVDWLGHAIATADADDEAQLLRLESDARCVQVVTLHKSKGLEYPLVFLPFACIATQPRGNGRNLVVPGAGGRALHWKVRDKSAAWEAAKKAATHAQRAEDARLLYVALTRARDALWIATGAFNGHERAATHAMLGDIPALAATLGEALQVDAVEPPATLPWLPPAGDAPVPPARTPRRALSSDWWVHSFTQLAHADGVAEIDAAATQAAPGGRDEGLDEGVDEGIDTRSLDEASLGTRSPDRRLPDARSIDDAVVDANSIGDGPVDRDAIGRVVIDDTTSNEAVIAGTAKDEAPFTAAVIDVPDFDDAGADPASFDALRADTWTGDGAGESAPDPRFGGTRFGVVLHDALEHADFARWRDWQPGAAAPEGEREGLAAALARGGYAAGDIDDGVDVLARLAGATLTARLPEGTRLCDVPAHERRAEIEFQFALAPTRVDELLALLHRHDVVRARSGFGARRVLEGLMTGLVDLTYRVDNRWYVLDYKSNRLPRYDAASMREAMARSEYDLQALLYTLALHRWLGWRMGAAYDLERDLGGVRYVFCRGLDPRDPAAGMHAFRFDPALVRDLDALFAGARA